MNVVRHDYVRTDHPRIRVLPRRPEIPMDGLISQ